jgi:hypothetical protein
MAAIVVSMLRQRRCDVCGDRLEERLPKRSAMPLVSLYGTAAERSGSAQYLCDTCRFHNDLERAATIHGWEREGAEEVGRCAAWLRAAPVLTELPAPIGGSTLNGINAFSPFVEILDDTTAVQRFTGRRLAFRNVPAEYQDVLSAHHDRRTEITFWSGSVFRLPDGRIAVHWRPVRTHTAD